MRPGRLVALLGALVVCPAFARAQPNASPGTAASLSAPRAAVESDAGAVRQEPGAPWSFSVAAFTYCFPGETCYVSPIATADRRGLHLEARYAYEARGAASLWAGWNFGFGETVTLDLTPMLGGVIGDLEGIAVGLELDVRWKGLSFYYEGEFVYDLEDDRGSFLYGWSELSYSPVEWFRAGLVGQRTQLYEAGLDVQRGVLVGFGTWIGLTAYFFDPGGDDHFEVLVLSAEF